MLRLYKKHPSVDDRMDKSTGVALYYLVFIHILFSIYFHGNNDIFEEELDASGNTYSNFAKEFFMTRLDTKVGNS